MKKLILGLGLLLSGAIAHAQNGLEGLVVEKYYVSNAADAAYSTANGSGILPTGSVTFRIYADMLPGYNFQAIYGTPGASGHTMLINTTTAFFNNENFGSTTPSASAANARKETTLIDSYFSVGGAASGKVGVLKAEDTDGSTGNAQNILQNNVPSMLGAINIGTAVSLSAFDGMITGSPVAVTYVGITGAELSALDALSQVGNSFSTSNGSVAALGGAVGPTAANRVLIGQFTTDGVLHFEFNIQIGTPGGGVQNYVASNPVGAEISIPSLTQTLNAPNLSPIIAITAPTNGSTFLVGQTVGITVNTTDPDGTVDSVQYYVDGVKVGSKVGAPYNTPFNWTAVVGAHALTAKATDNGGNVVTSAAINITVGNIIAPTVSITSPANGATFFENSTVAINATAADADGTVDSVQFYVDGVYVGSNTAGPYTFSWIATPIGAHTLTAKAYDNNGASTVSAPVNISVFSSSNSYAITSSSNQCDGGVFCMPVKALVAVSNVIGYDVVLNYDNTMVQPTGVVTVFPDLINPNYTSTAYSIPSPGTMLISVFFNASAPPTAAFTGIGNLICVEFAKIAGFGAVDTAVFTVPSLQESYFNGVQPKLVSPGSFVTYQDTIFSSNLRFWFDNSPIKYNSAAPAQYLITNIYGTDSANCAANTTHPAVQPDLNGHFDYNFNFGQHINIQKDIPGTTNVQPVINGFDAFLTRRVLVDDVTFIPSIYQVIAMDVNTDGVISAGDLSQINQRTVLIIPEYKQAWNYNASGVSDGRLSKDWLFINSDTLNGSTAYQISSTYPANNGIGYSKYKVPVVPHCLQVPSFTSGSCISIGNDTYKGVLLGDANGNYASYNSGPNPYKVAGSKVVFDLSKAVVANGYADVPVTVWSDETVNALDFALQLNESNVAYSAVVNHTSNLESLSNYNTADQTLRFTSYSLQNVESGKSVVSVRLAVKGAQLNETDLKSVEAYLNGEKVEVDLNGSIAENAVNVYPNPAMDVLNIVASENAIIQLISLDGSSIVLQQNIYAGQNVALNTSALANGVYTLKISGSNFVSVKKVVIQK